MQGRRRRCESIVFVWEWDSGLAERAGGLPGGTAGCAQTEILNLEQSSQPDCVIIPQQLCCRQEEGRWEGSFRAGILPRGCNLQEKG